MRPASKDERLKHARRTLASAVHDLAVALERGVEHRYAEAHGGRIPGSSRTARLRKKRRDAVLRWWREQ